MTQGDTRGHARGADAKMRLFFLSVQAVAFTQQHTQLLLELGGELRAAALSRHLPSAPGAAVWRLLGLVAAPPP